MIDRRLAPLLLLLAAACSSPADDSAPASGDEAQQLNEAAAMLDANSVGTDEIDTNAEAMAR